MRNELPTRRPNVTTEGEWNGHRLSISIGFDPATGKPAEVFADSIGGGHMQDTIRDACVWASILLQTGSTGSDLLKSLGRVPDYTGTERPASPLGTIAQAVVEASEWS